MNFSTVEAEAIPGAQVVSRVTAVLRALSTTMPRGAGTSALARTVGISRPTAHRLLSALAVEGFVDRDRSTGHWLLGPEMYLLGAVAAERYDITELGRVHVEALAEATGESAFLSVRRGNETVCLLRRDGSFPLRSFVLYEGKRFPLGVASAGLVMLAFMAPHAIERYLAQADLAARFGEEHAHHALSERIAQTQTLGYAVNPGLIVEGSWGMGAAVFDSADQPTWALSLTGVESRFSEDRRPRLGRLLLDHAHQLTQRIARS